MKNQVTFGYLLTIIAIMVIPLIIWGVNVERRFEQVIDNTEKSDVNSQEIKYIQAKMQENHEEQMKATHRIELLLTKKADR